MLHFLNTEIQNIKRFYILQLCFVYTDAFSLLCLHFPSEYFTLEKLLKCKEEQKAFFATGDRLVLNNSSFYLFSSP